MNLQALAGETATASTDPNFNNNTFEEKFNNGWLKWYYYASAICAIAYLLNGTNCVWTGLSWLGSYFTYAIALFATGAAYVILGLSFFLQFQAIKTRSLEKQDMAIRICQLFIVANLGCGVAQGLFHPSAGLIGSIISAAIFSAFGCAYLFVALNVKRIMLGKSEESFRFDKSAFQA